MMSVWPSSLLMGSLMVRISESELPPAGNGTSSVIGFTGQGCAALATIERTKPAASDATAPNTRTTAGIKIAVLERSAAAHRRLIVSTDVGHRFGPALDLDQRRLRYRTLRELRRALVERQHIRIAMAIERADRAGLIGIVPGAGLKLQHAAAHGVGHDSAGETRAALIE